MLVIFRETNSNHFAIGDGSLKDDGINANAASTLELPVAILLAVSRRQHYEARKQWLTKLGSANITAPLPNTWYKVRIEAVGRTIKCYLGDFNTPLITVEDGALPGAGGTMRWRPKPIRISTSGNGTD